MTERQIAAAVGMPQSTVHTRIAKAVQERVRPEVDELRALAEDRLDDSLRQVYRVLATPDITADIRLKAVLTHMKVEERRARLLGLDAPVVSEVQLSRRIELESQMSAGAVIAVVEAMGLSPQRQQWALDVAAHSLIPESPDPGPMPDETPAIEPHPSHANGVEHVYIKGKRYDYAGTAPLPSRIVDGEVLSDVLDGDLTASETTGGTGGQCAAYEAQTAAKLAALAALRVSDPDLFDEVDDDDEAL
jgi:hypothetical protein